MGQYRRKDPLSKVERSKRMSLVRATDTKPEMRVRRLVHALGYRYRLHVRDLPGCPDLVLRSRRKVIFVHGCFWHRHDCPMGNRMPKSKVKFWRAKLEGNKNRDEENLRLLADDGWSALVVWECETSKNQLKQLERRVWKFLGP